MIAEHTTTSGIDASLAAGGSIAGVVTRTDDGEALANVTVNALDMNGEIAAFARTDLTGGYHVDGLPAGSYRVQFAEPGPGLSAEYWENAYSFDAAKIVVVTESQTTTGIDAALETVGYISGSVTKSSDGTRALGRVTITSVDDDRHAYFSGVSNDGTYQVAVAPGEYRVLFEPFDSDLRRSTGPDAFTKASATPVTVPSGASVGGIDAQLDAAAIVAGTVTLDTAVEREVTVEAWSGNQIVGTTFATLRPVPTPWRSPKEHSSSRHLLCSTTTAPRSRSLSSMTVSPPRRWRRPSWRPSAPPSRGSTSLSSRSRIPSLSRSPPSRSPRGSIRAG